VGRWSEAEVAILDALGPSASQALVHRVEATARLAELRLLQGRVEEAAALLAPYEDCLACYGPLARLHLATGEPDLAAAAIERARRELVGDRLREGPLLALLVQVEVARDALDAADRAADALALVAAEVEGPVLAAEASLAAGRVAAARADHERASAHLRDAVHRLGGDERPLLAGQIRLELAAVLTDAGDGPGAIGEARAALALFSRLGAQPFVDQATALLRSLGDSQRPPRAPAAAVGALTAREREVLELIRQGLTNAEIGDRLYISAKTAEHHVSRVLTKLGVRSRAEAAAVATTAMARN
jgi:DNA-binding CsgD family transcriptional regulator